MTTSGVSDIHENDTGGARGIMNIIKCISDTPTSEWSCSNTLVQWRSHNDAPQNMNIITNAKPTIGSDSCSA